MASEADTNKLLMVIIAILLPPVAVLVKRGLGLSALICLILTLFFWLPGFLYALYVVLKG